MAFLELWEIGYFHVPFQWDNLFLFFIFWGLFLIGALIQTLLLSKANTKTGKFGFPIILCAFCIVLETACQLITGWDRLVWLVFYGFALTLLFGAILSILLRMIQNKIKKPA